MAVINRHLLLEFQQRPEWEGFTELQKEFFRFFFAKRNIFLTGPAGTGKTFAIEKLIEFLDEVKHPYGKTATTGVAALNVGGSTIHSWAGLGIADDDGMELLDKVAENKKACNRIKGARLLIIDEISMAKADLMDKIDIVCQYIRNNPNPFGGLQVVFVGDFLQLPPVFNRLEDEKFAFDSEAWKTANIKTIHLTEIVRQHDEPHFAKFLNEVRTGADTDFGILEPCLNRVFPNDGIKPVKLFCKNYNVDEYNREKLLEISSPSKKYYAVDDGPGNWKSFFDKNCRAPSELELRVGAQVMLLTNLAVESRLVNGSIGVVEKMYDDHVLVRFESGTYPIEPFEWTLKQGEINVLGEMKRVKVASRKQIPLRLAWAVTIHKCLGENSIIHLENSSKFIKNVGPDNTYSVANRSNHIDKVHTMNNHDAVKITLKSGKEIVCSPTHKIAVGTSLSQIAFSDALSLKEGDLIVSKKRFPTSPTPTIPYEMCWLMGALVGDGCYSENNIGNGNWRVDFTNKPTECGNVYKKLVQSLFGLTVGTTNRPNNKSKTYYFCSKNVWETFVKYGMRTAKRETKRVPDGIFSTDRLGIANFICGLIDSGGHVNKRNIVITNVAKQMLLDVQCLLEILGYRSFLAPMGKPSPTQHQAYQLQIYSYEARGFLTEFRHLLKARGKYKHMKAIMSYSRKKVKVQINDLTLTSGEIERLKLELRPKYGKDYGKSFRLHLPNELSDYLQPGHGGFDRFVLRRFVSEIPDFSTIGLMCKAISNAVNAELFFDPVISVEPVLNQTLIDITLDKEHTYFANGMLHHNCQGATLDRAEVDASEAFACGQVYVALSRVRNLASLKLKKFSKNRVTVNRKCLDFYRKADEDRSSVEQFFESE